MSNQESSHTSNKRAEATGSTALYSGFAAFFLFACFERITTLDPSEQMLPLSDRETEPGQQEALQR